MTPERERDVERICRAALERPVAERTGFLTDACGGDVDLRQAAERLVAQEEAAASFLETPAWVIAGAGDGRFNGRALDARQDDHGGTSRRSS